MNPFEKTLFLEEKVQVISKARAAQKNVDRQQITDNEFEFWTNHRNGRCQCFIFYFNYKIKENSDKTFILKQ